jgi:hypothetical protein
MVHLSVFPGAYVASIGPKPGSSKIVQNKNIVNVDIESYR